MSHRTFMLSCSAVAVACAALAPAPSVAETVVRTAWGAPDLRGVWDFSTTTPFQRPEELGDKAFLTEEEAARRDKEAAERDERIAARPAERTTATRSVDRREDGTPGFYNSFWLDTGLKTLKSRQTSQIVDPPNGRLPALTASAQQRVDARRAHVAEHQADSWLELSSSDRCLMGLNAGPPIMPGFYNQNLHILQTPDHVALVTEMIHTVRVVPLDGRPALDRRILQWSGDSRGHWEGDTLVIETSNFHGKNYPLVDPANFGAATDGMTLVERITQLDADTIEYAYTVTDPNTWSSPWSGSLQFPRSGQPMYEYACHEGNYGLPNVLAGARAAEAAAAAKR